MSFLPSRSSLPLAKKSHPLLGLILVLLLALGLLSACGGDPEPAPQLPTRTPIPTFTPTPFVIQAGAAQAPAVAAPAAPADAAPVEAAPAPAPVEAAPAPQPTVAEVAMAIVISPIINVRAGPGTNYDLAGQANRGEELTILARDPAGEWFKVCCVNGQEVWIAAFLVDTQGPVDSVAVAENIPAPPPTSIPAPVAPAPAAPSNTPVPAQPTQPPAPSFAFSKFGDIAPRENSNQVVSFFGTLFNSGADAALGGGYKLVVTGPGGQAETSFGAVFENGNPGLESEFIYNAKVEFTGGPAGTYKAYVADGGGNQLSEAFEYTVAGNTRTFLPRWKQN